MTKRERAAVDVLYAPNKPVERFRDMKEPLTVGTVGKGRDGRIYRITKVSANGDCEAELVVESSERLNGLQRERQRLLVRNKHRAATASYDWD